MIRLFVAIDLPDAVRDRLAALAGGIPGARWLEPESYHVTLHFIGEVPEDTAEEIHAALEAVRAPGVTLAIGGVGSFSQGHRVHSLYAGVDRSPPLLHLHDRIQRAVTQVCPATDGRRFTPHVTLARLKGATPSRVQDFLAANAPFRLEPFPVARFTLFSSHLGRGGASYVAEAEYPLDAVTPP
ncbi:MAG: RNA 2',3'-cyclic phosphodiesterase [Alphaproteobacteria bacterium]